MATPHPAAKETVIVSDYIQIASKSDIVSNPIHKMVLSDEGMTKEARIEKINEYLIAGLKDNTATEKELDQRKKALAEFHSFIQVVRKQLGSEQAKEILGKTHANFQRIVNETTTDVFQFEQELSPLSKLADLFTRYGADGNIVDKINKAKEQKRVRERSLIFWQNEHDDRLRYANKIVATLQNEVTFEQENIKSAWFGKTAIQTRINALTEKLDSAKAARQTVIDEKPTVDSVEISEQIDEGILDLQNIGGAAFKTAVSDLLTHTEITLAKISASFDEAIIGLTNTRDSFMTMDRNCSDAILALSVLEHAVQMSEKQAIEIADGIIKNLPQYDINDGMEKERRASTIISYTTSLKTFLKDKDTNVAIASLRSCQAVIQNILRMNALALESANTHKITGIANTADAVTIIIGAIIEVCNRAASQALADGLTKIRSMAEESSGRMASGSYVSLHMQNIQLESFVESVKSLREMTNTITANSVDLLKKQFELVNTMRSGYF